MMLLARHVGAHAQIAALARLGWAAAVAAKAVTLVPVGHGPGVGQYRSIRRIEQRRNLPQFPKLPQFGQAVGHNGQRLWQIDCKVGPILMEAQERGRSSVVDRLV